MTKKCHNHRLLTDPLHLKEGTRNTDIQYNLSAGSDKIHAKSKFLSTWWSTDFSKNYTEGRLMDLLFSPNLFFLKSFTLLRKSGLYLLTIILTFSLKSTGK